MQALKPQALTTHVLPHAVSVAACTISPLGHWTGANEEVTWRRVSAPTSRHASPQLDASRLLRPARQPLQRGRRANGLTIPAPFPQACTGRHRARLHRPQGWFGYWPQNRVQPRSELRPAERAWCTDAFDSAGWPAGQPPPGGWPRAQAARRCTGKASRPWACACAPSGKLAGRAEPPAAKLSLPRRHRSGPHARDRSRAGVQAVSSRKWRAKAGPPASEAAAAAFGGQPQVFCRVAEVRPVAASHPKPSSRPAAVVRPYRSIARSGSCVFDRPSTQAFRPQYRRQGPCRKGAGPRSGGQAPCTAPSARSASAFTRSGCP